MNKLRIAAAVLVAAAIACGTNDITGEAEQSVPSVPRVVQHREVQSPGRLSRNWAVPAINEWGAGRDGRLHNDVLAAFEQYVPLPAPSDFAIVDFTRALKRSMDDVYPSHFGVENPIDEADLWQFLKYRQHAIGHGMMNRDGSFDENQLDAMLDYASDMGALTPSECTAITAFAQVMREAPNTQAALDAMDEYDPAYPRTIRSMIDVAKHSYAYWKSHPAVEPGTQACENICAQHDRDTMIVDAVGGLVLASIAAAAGGPITAGAAYAAGYFTLSLAFVSMPQGTPDDDWDPTYPSGDNMGNW